MKLYLKCLCVILCLVLLECDRNEPSPPFRQYIGVNISKIRDQYHDRLVGLYCVNGNALIKIPLSEKDILVNETQLKCILRAQTDEVIGSIASCEVYVRHRGSLGLYQTFVFCDEKGTILCLNDVFMD
jgi:hypothetical protein